MVYFERTGEHTFRATEHTGGAWSPDEQHVAASLGLLAHVVEVDRDRRRGPGLLQARLSYDILGTMPVGPVQTEVEVIRPGRTIELVEARMVAEGRVGVRLRSWLLEPRDSGGVAATRLPPIPGPEELDPWEPTSIWPGGFIATAQVRRRLVEPGRGNYWVRSEHPLLDAEPVGPVPNAARLFDIANGMAVLASPEEVGFPNVDLTAHLTREPIDGWLGFDTSVTFGADGLGLTSSVLHDEAGPLGTLAQCLTVRPGAGMQPRG